MSGGRRSWDGPEERLKIIAVEKEDDRSKVHAICQHIFTASFVAI